MHCNWVVVSKIILYIGIRVRFTQYTFTGTEATGFVPISLELVGGVSTSPFNVTITPSEQYPSSAKSNIIMCNLHTYHTYLC